MIFMSLPVTQHCIKKSILNLGIKLFNKLLERKRGLKTLMQFKREVKLLHEQNAFCTIDELHATLL
jgi:hypothetical protein